MMGGRDLFLNRPEYMIYNKKSFFSIILFCVWTEEEIPVGGRRVVITIVIYQS